MDTQDKQPQQELLNNRYQLEEPLGKGGMAVVHRAKDLMLERQVAIKILRENFSKDPTFRERFRQEAKAAANLSHPNIVTVHDFGFDENQLYIVMEHIPGKDLNSIIQDIGRFKIEDGLDLIIQACAGIGYAHRAGLVHCDVKPHNFLITPDNRLKVTDFGIARALAAINPNEEAEVVWGSPQFFSPEQAVGKPPSPASDVYSLGIVMYLMFTGQLPFIAKTTSELARQHRRATSIPPSELNPFIPIELEEIIRKVLSKEPSARYRTADQLGRVLITFRKKSKMARTEPQAISEQPQNSIIKDTVEMTKGVTAEIGEADFELEIDWFAVGLGVVSLITVGGLIPFWMWVYFVFNPPLR